MELWVLVIQLLQHRKEKFNTESFWVQLHQILQTVGNTDTDNLDTEEELDSDVFVLNISPAPSKPQGFCLWVTTHLAHLFTFDHHGNSTSPDPTQSCFFAIQMTVEKMMREPVKEETLRACLRCCLSVSSLWSPPKQLLTVLWEHFSRKLNDRFQLHTTSIEGLAVINKSSKSLTEKCRKWTSDDDNGLEQESSFHLFLRLLAKLLGHSGALSEWRQIKGRFFSKFHQRRMQELGETGLHNMTCLFLTVALCVDAEEIARKLLTLYDMVDPTSAYGRLRAQVWCGALAVTQLLVKERKNFSFLAEKLASSFNSMAKQLSGSLMDYSQKQELSPLITLYVDGVRDIVEQSELDGAEHLFIDEGIGAVLRSCSDAQMRHILTALDSVVMRLRCLVSGLKQVQPWLREYQRPSHAAFADRLWLHVFPFVCDHASTLTPPLSLADLAVSFTHLALDFPAPPSVCSEGIRGVASQFVSSESTHPSIACHYLNQVLADQSLKNAIINISTTTTNFPVPSSAKATTSALHKASLPLTQTDVVKCWWRCVLLMPPSSSSLVELTQHVLSLPDTQWLTSSNDDNVRMDDLGSVGWKQLLKAIGSRFHNSQNLLEKQKVRSQVMPYFVDSVHQVAAVLRTSGPLETLLNVYRVLGYLLKHCAPLLYLQSKPCPLPEIIKSLILPAPVFNTDRPLNPNFISVVRDTLHLFLEGLGRLDYRRDTYIQRQVRSIVAQYLPRFSLSVMDVYNHPVLRLLGRLAHQTAFTDADFDGFVADLIVENLRKNSNTVSSDVISALRTRFRRS
ncbi:protein MMS22-like [Littorina saxatilis]